MARARGGRRCCPRRALPAHRWTFDVTVRRGTAGVLHLGRWTFGRHRGVEEATGHDMRRLGHPGDYRYTPVGWPPAAYYARLCELYHDIRERSGADGPRTADDPGV